MANGIFGGSIGLLITILTSPLTVESFHIHGMNAVSVTPLRGTISTFSRVFSTGSATNFIHPNGHYKILPSINSPADIKALDKADLPLLCDDLRSYLIDTISKIGGHFSSSLGVVELTVALHRIFDSPKDRIVWDIGHQAYIHKIITGRRDALKHIRQPGGISGFCRIHESPHDQFGAGHSSTSIGALQGLFEGDALLNKADGNCYVCIIGDGGLTGGMAYEALNYSDIIKSPLLIIYNDNEQSSLPTGLPAAHGTGPITPFFMNHTAKRSLISAQEAIKSLHKNSFPNIIGPIDGHDLEGLENVLSAVNAKMSSLSSNNSNRKCGPIILHLKTIKGKGYQKAVERLDRMHSIKPPSTSNKSVNKTFTQVFAEQLVMHGRNDDKIVAITAAMPAGTGVEKFGVEFPNRTFDVGIAEQHAITFSAGLALAGTKAFCCIYSTFLQRGLDQIIHDVALQNVPVKFVIDRAGYVGEDGSSHHGNYDISMLSPLHNLTIMAPSNELELEMMLKQMLCINDRPSAIRFPKGAIFGQDVLREDFNYTNAEIDKIAQMKIDNVDVNNLKARVIKNGTSKVALLGFGTMLYDAIQALKMLNVDATVVDMRYMNPLDVEIINKMAPDHDIIFTVENGSCGGFGSAVLEHVSDLNLRSKKKLMVKTIHYPRKYIHHAPQKLQNSIAEVDAAGIANIIKTALDDMGLDLQ
ncbi:bifunctional Transketolase [Babesia duncani]|uniref:1-deoxy-D-xylulose-5-phosphate synthase n=1 Tax=Babesia duncani TaxID=323732 RepID=A0AAD9PLB9_9APIC|nr:bifunctional Transketolase [Babesia duncani]